MIHRFTMFRIIACVMLLAPQALADATKVTPVHQGGQACFQLVGQTEWACTE